MKNVYEKCGFKEYDRNSVDVFMEIMRQDVQRIMRVLADDQYNKLTERIKELEDENQHLKKLLDDAGIPQSRKSSVNEAGKNELFQIRR